MNISDHDSSLSGLVSAFKDNIAQLVQQHYDTLYSLNYDETNENTTNNKTNDAEEKDSLHKL